MTKVTDKMVDAAMDSAFNHMRTWITREHMRAAIEAALAAREPANAGELAKVLRIEADIVPSEHWNWLNPLLTNSADAIDELVEAAKDVCSFDWSGNDDDAVATVYELRALLTRMGVKL